MRITNYAQNMKNEKKKKKHFGGQDWRDKKRKAEYALNKSHFYERQCYNVKMHDNKTLIFHNTEYMGLSQVL